MSAIKQWVPDDIETGQEEVATTIEAPPQKGSDSSKTKVTPEATGTDTGTDPGTPEATGTDTGTDPGTPEATGTDTGTDPGAPEATGTDTGTDPGAPEATGTDTGTDPGTPEATEIDIAQMAKKLSEQRKRKRKMTYDQRFKKKNVAIEMELVRLIDAESGGERGEVKRIFNTALRMYYGLPLKGYEDE